MNFSRPPLLFTARAPGGIATLLLSVARPPPQRELERWRAISCDVAGRRELLRTHSRNLQIESLICDCLEDEGPFTLSQEV